MKMQRSSKKGMGTGWLWVVVLTMALAILGSMVVPAGMKAGTAFAQEEASVYLEQPSQSLAPGKTTTLDIKIENVSNLYGVELHLSFPPELLEVVDTNPEKEGVQIEPGDFLIPSEPAGIAVNRANNNEGMIDFAVTLTGDEAIPGEGDLATITFRCKAKGTANISFQNPIPDEDPVKLADSEGNSIPVTWEGIEIITAKIIPSVSIEPDLVKRTPGEAFSIDTVIDSATYSLKACHVELSYDSDVLEATDYAYKELLGVENILEEPGSGITTGLMKYGITRTAGNPAEPVSGALITTEFMVKEDAPEDSYNLDLHDVTLKGVTGADIPNVVVSDGMVTVSLVYKGDFDADHDIDFDDFVAFGDAYDSVTEDPNYNVIGDFDDSGGIDFDDFVAFGDVYGTVLASLG